MDIGVTLCDKREDKGLRRTSGTGTLACECTDAGGRSRKYSPLPGERVASGASQVRGYFVVFAHFAFSLARNRPLTRLRQLTDW